jgi:hypothetical protein
MALSNKLKHRYGPSTITVSDGTGTPLTCVLRFDSADFTFDGVSVGLKDVKAYQGRGLLRSLRAGERTFPTIGFSGEVAEFSETSTGTLLDMIFAKTGTPYATRVSTTTAKGDVVTFDIEFDMEGEEAVVFEDVHLVVSFAEGEPNKLTFSGTVYGDMTGGVAIAVD